MNRSPVSEELSCIQYNPGEMVSLEFLHNLISITVIVASRLVGRLGGSAPKSHDPLEDVPHRQETVTFPRPKMTTLRFVPPLLYPSRRHQAGDVTGMAALRLRGNPAVAHSNPVLPGGSVLLPSS